MEQMNSFCQTFQNGDFEFLSQIYGSKILLYCIKLQSYILQLQRWMDTCVQIEKKVNTISKIILSFFFFRTNDCMIMRKMHLMLNIDCFKVSKINDFTFVLDLSFVKNLSLHQKRVESLNRLNNECYFNMMLLF